MGKKKVIALIVSVLLVIGVFGGITVVVTQSALQQEAEAPAQSADKVLERADNQDFEAMKEKAESMIGEQVTREDIEREIGPFEEFALDSNGCERGVMAGLFYYKGFTVRTRTYDRGNTFTIFTVK